MHNNERSSASRSGPQSAKEALRAEMRVKRLALTPQERDSLAQAAARVLLQTPVWQQAHSVALYVAVRGEMDTDSLLQAAWQSGKQVLLPRCVPRCVMDGPTTMRFTGGPDVLRFIPCQGPEALAPGAFGIPEPPDTVDTIDLACANEPEVVPDLIVAPGLAFDRTGTRLGQGGGFYDRYFFRPEIAGVLRIGYSYAFQLVEHLPRDPWDLSVDCVCTEQGILWTVKT